MEYVIDEIYFEFKWLNQIVKAYVRVYNSGDKDVELIENHSDIYPEEVWSIGWNEAVKLNLI